MIKWHKDDLDNRMYMVIEGGKKISMPRYYKDKIYTEEERERVAYCQALKIKEITWKEMEEKGQNYEREKRAKMEELFAKNLNDQSKRNKV